MKDFGAQQVVMVGASFEEIHAAAKAAVKQEIDVQVQQVTPAITKALTEGAAALNQANALIRRYRIALYIMLFLCGLQGAVLLSLLLRNGAGR